jgi:hypothetical protein
MQRVHRGTRWSLRCRSSIKLMDCASQTARIIRVPCRVSFAEGCCQFFSGH